MAPVIPDWLLWTWRAWNALHHERPHTTEGMAAPMGGTMIRSVPGRITWSSVIRYAEHHGYGHAQTEFLLRVLEKLDETFLEWWSEHARSG